MGDDSRLLQAVEEYHASYLSIHGDPRALLDENREVIERINRRLGYRLHLVEMDWPASVVFGEPFDIVSKWMNTGVAPCHPGGIIAVTLAVDDGTSWAP